MLALLVAPIAACGDDVGAGDSTAETTAVAPATTAVPTSTAAPATTATAVATTVSSTTAAPTTAAPTTATTESPYPKLVPGRGEDEAPFEAGTYHVVWAGPDFDVTFSEKTIAQLDGMALTAMFLEPASGAEWEHPDNWDPPVVVAQFAYYFDYEGDSVDEVRTIEDPAAFVLGHPYLDSGEPVAVSIDGYDGLQFDAVVTGAAYESDWMSFGVYVGSAPVSMPVGSAVRILYFEGDDKPFWVLVTTTGAGFDEGTAFADEMLATIDFT
jgi:hypothetical protein